MPAPVLEGEKGWISPPMWSASTATLLNRPDLFSLPTSDFVLLDSAGNLLTVSSGRDRGVQL